MPGEARTKAAVRRIFSVVYSIAIIPTPLNKRFGLVDRNADSSFELVVAEFLDHHWTHMEISPKLFNSSCSVGLEDHSRINPAKVSR
jgi:hypothetical protein